jgi:flagellar L-ring protein precursor FlgH
MKAWLFALFVAVNLVSRIGLAQTSPQPSPRARDEARAAPTAPSDNRDPNQPPPDTADLLRRGGGSLLKATLGLPPDPGQARLADVSFFAVPEPEPRTLRKHDLVTVIIREESEFKSEGTTDLKKQAELNAKIEEFIRFSLDNFELKPNVGEPFPEIKTSADRSFKGEATVDRTDTLTARMTAEVLDVKPNGTLVLQARKRIKTDEEVQQFVLTGICRVEDVSADNTVLSTQLYDLELEKKHTGAVRDTTRRGWVPKLLDVLNPF